MTREIESGDIYFFYRPRVGEKEPEGIEQVQRLYLVLNSSGLYRKIVIGKKQMPEVVRGEARPSARIWGFIEIVTRDRDRLVEDLSEAEYETKTRGIRRIEPARPAGEGKYAVVEEDGNSYLAYALEFPKEAGEVQRELGIREKASYVLSIKNPEKGAPTGLGLREEQKPELPARLQEKFGDRRFVAATDPELLNFEGLEMLLIGAHEEPEAELGIKIGANWREREPDLLRELETERLKSPTEPLLRGTWA